MPEPVIVLENVGMRFSRNRRRHRRAREFLAHGHTGTPADEFWPLRNVSFKVDAGEAVGVVGRNGQGKSTLLKLIAGVLLPDEGHVSVHQGVAPLIEITGGFVGDLTARDNINLVSGLHGMRRREIAENFDAIVEFAEVGKFLDTPYRHFSSGMKVRLAFAVVSQLSEPILLVDEILAVGDKAFREKCYRRIESLLSAGQTLFLVSHSDANLKQFCQRGLYLEGGALQADASIEDVLALYADDQRRGFEPRESPGLPVDESVSA